MSVWYRLERLEASSVSSGINGKIRTAVFSTSITINCMLIHT